jgi:hypothetical protein
MIMINTGLSIAWAGLMCFDSIVFAFTIQKAICMWKMGSRRLFHVLLRDGELFFSSGVHLRVESHRYVVLLCAGAIYYL